MTKQNHRPGACAGGPACAHQVTVHWNDSERRLQRLRFAGGIEPQYCDDTAQTVCSQIKAQISKLAPEDRIDVPSPRLFSRLFGVYRAAATLKSNPMTTLELSVAEIAKIAGYSKAHTAAALRWLGTGVIVRKGKVIAQGLGLIGRTVRKGRMTVCGRVRGVFRTSATALTKTGRALLGLVVSPRSRNKCTREQAKQQRRELVLATKRRALDAVKKTLSQFWDKISHAQDAPPEPQGAMGSAALEYMAAAQAILARNNRPPMEQGPPGAI